MAAEIAQMPEAPTVANIDISLQISLPQMLDLALGAPEVGAVNFNILHNFLHVLLHQTNLQTTKVEYHGENADRIKKMVTSLKPSPDLQLPEHNIIDATGKISQIFRRDDGADADVLTGDIQMPEEEILKVTEDRQQIDLEKVPEDILININKRLDVNEQGIDKLTTMIQDVIKGDVSVADSSSINARLNELEDKVSKMEQWFTDLQAITDILTQDITVPTTDIGAEPVKIKEEDRGKEISKLAIDKIRKATPDNIAEIREDVTTLKTNVAHIQQELQDLNERVGQPIIDKEKIVGASEVANLEQCLEAIQNVETTHGKALDDVTQRMVALETEVGHLLEKVDSMQEVDKTDYVNELIAKVQGLETEMEKIGQATNKLLDDKEKQETHINTLLEQIELLKTVKASKEDLEDALADKADAQAMNRKVSRDQFDTACDDLGRGLGEAIDKLTKQESIWEQALDEVQNEIATKMDKVEILPLKDFVNDKLKSLQEKLKFIIEARREIEAAGTKKLLRDVQCISCDKDVVMKTEELNRFRAEPLPCTISIKPYLTYELDKIRKQQRRLPYRNMIQFEAAMQEETKKMKAKEEMLAKTPRDHLCNRYCGGSHTITTPQQKVTRTGHFLTQWGPGVRQLTDGLIRGKDGQMYRSRFMPDKDVCGPDCWESQISEETGPSECTSTTPRKSPRQNSAGNQKRSSRKQSKEPKESEKLEEKSREI